MESFRSKTPGGGNPGGNPHIASGWFRFYYNCMKTDQTTRLQRIVLSLLITALLAIVGVGCNTAHGFGKDVKNAGESIENGTK